MFRLARILSAMPPGKLGDSHLLSEPTRKNDQVEESKKFFGMADKEDNDGTLKCAAVPSRSKLLLTFQGRTYVDFGDILNTV